MYVCMQQLNVFKLSPCHCMPRYNSTATLPTSFNAKNPLIKKIRLIFILNMHSTEAGILNIPLSALH